MSTETSTSLRMSRVIGASRERVFEAWTRPEHMKQWACPEHATVDDVQVDLTVGGRYRIRMKDAEGNTWTAYGVYREIEAPTRLVYTWDWEEEGYHMGDASVVTVEFNDLGGSTEVVLLHAGFPVKDVTDAHTEGWTSCLNRLVALFE